MADGPIKSFLVELGFRGDAAGAKKVVDQAAKVETDVTKATVEGADDRVEVEQKASGKRIGLLAAMGKILIGMEQDRAAKASKIRHDEAVLDEKVQNERARKEKERRAVAIRDLQAHATRMASFALKSVAAIEATALGIVAATDQAAKSMERLNYAARRSGATPSSMTASAYAFSQTGSTAEAGQAAVKAVGDKLKLNPSGYASMLRSMGVEARKANGEMRDAGDILVDMGDAFARIRKQGEAGYANARGYARAFDLNEDAMQTTADPRYRGMYQEQQSIDAKMGTDRGAAAEDGTKFEVSMRRLEAMADSVRAKVETNLFIKLTPVLDDLGKWVDAHGEQVASIVSRIADDLLNLATVMMKELGKVDWDEILGSIEAFGKGFDATTKKYFGETGTVAVAMAAFGLIVRSKVLTPLQAVADVLATVGGNSLVTRLLGGGSALPLMLNPAVLGTAAVGAVLASGDPEKSVLDGGRPDLGPRDNDLGLPGLEHEDLPENKAPSDSQAGIENKAKGFWAWMKDTAKGFGFGDRLGLNPQDPDARKVKDAIIATAEATKKLADGAGSSGGFSGVTASSGGLGGSGQHFGGGTSPGATLGDHAGPARPAKGALAANQKEAYAAALNEGLSPTAARALVANMSGEGLAVPKDYHWDSTHMASGIVQWDPSRSAAIKGKFGAMPHELSVADQTRAAIWEMRTNPAYAKTWTALQGSDPTAMVDTLVRNYEKPRDKEGAISARLGYLKGFNPSSPSPSAPAAPTASAPIPAGTSAKAITDAEVFAARQRLVNGGRDPKDKALVEHYTQQQSAASASTGANDGDTTITTIDRRERKFAPDAPAPKVEEPSRLNQSHPDDDRLSHARASDRPAKVSITEESLSRLTKMQHILAAKGGSIALPRMAEAHLSTAAKAAINNYRHSQVAMTHNPTFNIQGGDPHVMLADAHRLAGRGQADMVRNLSVMET